MNQNLSWGANALRRLRALRSQSGAFDLPSILVGVVVLGILTAGVLAAVFAVIPFAQDNAAKQDLDSVRTAEGVAKARDTGYLSKQGLIDAPYLSPGESVAVGANAEGTCYLGLSKSGTGKIFYSDNKSNEAKVLVAGATVNCLTTAEVDVLVDTIGGYGPGPVAGGAVDTDGDGIPDSEDPTPNGDGGAVTATWSSRTMETNYITDPSFETKGSAGWTIPREVRADGMPSSVAMSVSAAPGKGVGGGTGIMIVTDGTASDNMHDNYAYYELPTSPRDVYSAVNVSVRTDRTDYRTMYASVINYSAGGDVLDEGFISQKSVGGGSASEWQSMMNVEVPSGAVFYPEGAKRFLKIRVEGNWSDPALDNGMFYVDNVSLNESGTYFDGSTAAAGETSYEWSGPTNDSVSNKLMSRQVSIPSVITVGQNFTVQGRGYPANIDVRLRENMWWYGEKHVTTDASGNFTAIMNVPPNTDPNNGPVPGPVGPGVIDIFAGWDAPNLKPAVTFQ